MTAEDILASAERVMESVTFDVSGINGRGGNGGLTSTDTIRACDELRLVISRYRIANRETAK